MEGIEGHVSFRIKCKNKKAVQYQKRLNVLLDFGLFWYCTAFIYALAPSFTVKRIFCLLIIQMLLYILQLSYRLHRPGGGSRCPDLLLTSLLQTVCQRTERPANRLPAAHLLSGLREIRIRRRRATDFRVCRFHPLMGRGFDCRAR